MPARPSRAGPSRLPRPSARSRPRSRPATGRCPLRAPPGPASRPVPRAPVARRLRPGSCARPASACACRACRRGRRARPPPSRRRRLRVPARPPRRGARSPRSSAAAAAARHPRPPTGGAPRPVRHPARSPPHRQGAPGRPGARAAPDRALAWRECTAAAALSSASPSPTIRRHALPERAAAARGKRSAHRRGHGDDTRLSRWPRAPVLRLVPPAGAGAGPCRADPLLRALPRRRPPSRHRLRRRGADVARQPGLGEKLGYSLDELAEANRRSIRFVADIADREDRRVGRW